MKEFTLEDKNLVIELYGLNKDELRSTEKLYHRSSFSVCAAAKIVLGRRKTGFTPKE